MIPLADGALPLRFAEPCFQIFLVRAGPVPVDPELPARLLEGAVMDFPRVQRICILEEVTIEMPDRARDLRPEREFHAAEAKHARRDERAADFIAAVLVGAGVADLWRDDVMFREGHELKPVMRRFCEAKRRPGRAVREYGVQVQVAGENMMSVLRIGEDQTRGRRRPLIGLRHELGGSFSGGEQPCEHSESGNHCAEVSMLNHKIS